MSIADTYVRGQAPNHSMIRAEADRLTRQLITDILGIAATDVTPEQLFEYGVGSMDAGACSVLWLRDFKPTEGGTHALSHG